jgi:hypothetical protein
MRRLTKSFARVWAFVRRVDLCAAAAASILLFPQEITALIVRRTGRHSGWAL